MGIKIPQGILLICELHALTKSLVFTKIYVVVNKNQPVFESNFWCLANQMCLNSDTKYQHAFIFSVFRNV